MTSAFRVRATFEDSTKLSALSFPLNCLNLKGIQGLGDPHFLRRSNFNLLQVLDSCLAEDYDTGEQKQATRYIDAVSSTRFTLLAQGEAVSTWHADILNCTGIGCLDGLKLWPIMRPSIHILIRLPRGTLVGI